MVTPKSSGGLSHRLLSLERFASVPGSAEQLFRRVDDGEFHRVATSLTESMTLARYPSDLRPGAVFSYSLEQWPVTIHWEAVVSEYRPPHRIRWIKSRGYFPSWDLMLDLRRAGSNVDVEIGLNYEMPTGVVATLKNRYVVHKVMEDLLEAQLTALSLPRG